MRRVAVAGGHTAGHVNLALATAAGITRALPSVEVVFLGGARGPESRLAARAGVPFEAVPSSPYRGASAWAKLTAVWDLARGTLAARRILREQQVRLVLGFGGHASAGAVLAAKSLGLATALHEANLEPGLANRLLARVVDRVYLGHAAGASRFPVRKLRVVGNPVRGEIAAIGDGHVRPWPARGARLLVTGGTQGSAFINAHAAGLVSALEGLGCSTEVWHQTGQGSPRTVREAYRRARMAARVDSYIDDMARAYAWADFVVATAGAATLAEIASVGLPALLVPLGVASEDHQRENARDFAGSGAGLWVRESQWDARALAAAIHAILGDEPAWRRACANARRLARSGAARAIAADCDTLMRERG